MCGLLASPLAASPTGRGYSQRLDRLAQRKTKGAGAALLSLTGAAEDDCANRGVGHRQPPTIDPDPPGNQPMELVEAALSSLLNGGTYNRLGFRDDCIAAGGRSAPTPTPKC